MQATNLCLAGPEQIQELCVVWNTGICLFNFCGRALYGTQEFVKFPIPGVVRRMELG